MNSRGFTLIEIVIVILIMGIAALGLAAVIQQAMRDTHEPETMSTATALAVKEAECVMRVAYASVADEHRGSPQSYAGDFANYSWEVMVDNYDADGDGSISTDESNNYKQVEVRVHHSVIGYVSVVFLRTNY